MSQLEAELHELGYWHIAGIDEAGRGPLAGPVVAAAVVLCEKPIYGINDSKQVTPARREVLYDIILDTCQVAIAQVQAADIDRMNILEATRVAMQLAVNKLPTVDYTLCDAMTLHGLTCPQRSVVKGDTMVNAIAAASIVAKVTRDRLMCLYDREYPEYGFARHKGYGTANHFEAIRRHGLTPLHRRSFLHD
ncbi:MAG TPA: ribonuclease HII [Clostridiaceae bacterium]|nr:ribonuclease HII [Clostridiaceae bacterium]